MVKVTLKCPECGARLAASEEHAGKAARCPRCGAPVEIPPTVFSEPDSEALAKVPDSVAGACLYALRLRFLLTGNVLRCLFPWVCYPVKKLGELHGLVGGVLICLLPCFTAGLLAFAMWVFLPEFVAVAMGLLVFALAYVVVIGGIFFAVPSCKRMRTFLDGRRSRRERYRKGIALAWERVGELRRERLSERVEAELAEAALSVAARPEAEAPEVEVPPSYPALRILANLLGIAAWILLALGTLSVLIGIIGATVHFAGALIRAEEMSWLMFLNDGVLVVSGLGTVLTGLVLLAVSEALKLLTDMRSDTWRMCRVLQGVSDRLTPQGSEEADQPEADAGAL